MAENTKSAGNNVLSFKTPEPRFPKAAVDYIDALLTVQRDRFEQELNVHAISTDITPPEQPVSTHILADSDEFIGSGWSSLGSRRDGTAFRWMGRIGTLLLPLNLSEPRDFTIRGCGFTKRRFLKETTLWLDDQQVEFDMSRKGFNRWIFSGKLPAMTPRPYYMLRMQSPGTSRLAEGVEAFVSLAVNEVKVNC